MAHDLQPILAGLESEREADRLWAAYRLEEALGRELEAGRTEWGPVVEQALPALIRAIGDPHKGVQVHSANCLEFLAHHSDRVIPALREAMTGPDAWRAWGAAIVIARLGLWLPEAGPALGGAMGAKDRDVRWAAANYALSLGRKHPEAVAMVRELLGSENPIARKMAAYCLGAMGEYADVEAALAQRLDDPDRDVRRAVVLAIDKLPRISGPVKDRIRAMRTDDPDEFIRRAAAAVAAKF